MHPTQILIGEIAAIVEVAQSIPYYVSILRGNTRPQRASYGIWLSVEAIGISSYIASGATTTKWMPLISTFNSLVIFILAFKYGMGGFNKLDIVCLILAAIAIALWILTDNPALAVYMSELAAVIGYIPTIKKSYLYPKTESTLSWCMYVVAAALNLFALTSSRLVIVVPLVATLTLSSVVAGLVLFPKWQLAGIKKPAGVLK